MGGPNFRNRYEFDPETYRGESGLLGRLMSTMPDRQAQPGAGFVSGSNAALGFDPDNYAASPSTLLGTLLGIVQPSQANSDDGAFPQLPANRQTRAAAQEDGGAPQTRIIVRPLDAAPRSGPETYGGQGGIPRRQLPAQSEQRQYQSIPGSNPAPVLNSSVPQQTIQQYEADQAQQAREVAAARLARGVRNLTRSEPLDFDLMDIGKSAGIGLANGVVNGLGLAGEILTGFGYFPPHFIQNPIRRFFGATDLPADTPDWIECIKPDSIRHRIENHTGEFYEPKTRAGRYAETIGEMAPLILAEPGVIAAGWGRQAAAAALRALPNTLVKHAVAPGVAVQALEEALPDSKMGQALQKAYPFMRRGLPLALAARRYLSSRIAPN
jgi:hypothetical protein